MAAAEPIELLASHAVEFELRLPPAGLQHFELPESHACAHAGADRFRGRLLGGEPRGEMRQGIAMAAAISELRVGEQPALHARAEPLERFDQALDLHHIDADAANRHVASAPGTRVGPRIPELERRVGTPAGRASASWALACLEERHWRHGPWWTRGIRGTFDAE